MEYPSRRIGLFRSSRQLALELVTDVEERMEVRVEEIGIWVVFQVMTMIAQVMELVAKAEEVDGSSRG